MNEPASQYFIIDQSGLDYLASHDERLGALIAKTGPINRRIYPDPFTGLIRAITGQQISGKAHDAIWTRLVSSHAPFEPAKIASLPINELQTCGISKNKAEYLAHIAKFFESGELNSASLAAMDDNTLLDTLTRLRGVGRWTAEMTLIFTFQRPDVLSFDDLGIRRGMCRLYGYENLTRQVFCQHRQTYAPYATLAGMYLWEAAKGPAKKQTASR